MKLALLCSGYPPDLDAIGQYTRHLGLALAGQGASVTVLTAGERRFEDGPLRVRGVFDPADSRTLRAVPAAVAEAGAEWLVLQYNPFSYGRRGYAPGLVPALAGLRVALMAHETYVPPWPLKCALMQLWQVPQFTRLCRLAERVFVSTERWSAEVARVVGAPQARLLPVGSNIPRCPVGREEARARLGIAPGAWVAGIFGNRHPSRLLDWAGAAARGVEGSTVLYVGRDGDAARAACAGVPFRDEGALPDEEVALRLRAMDVLLSPFSDGISTRRSSALAGLRQGVPLVTTRAGWSDAVLVENPLVFSSPVEAGEAAFVAVARAAREAAGRGLPEFDFETSPFAWPQIAHALLAAL